MEAQGPVPGMLEVWKEPGKEAGLWGLGGGAVGGFGSLRTRCFVECLPWCEQRGLNWERQGQGRGLGGRVGQKQEAEPRRGFCGARRTAPGDVGLPSRRG